MTEWTIAQAAELYSIQNWGSRFFSINEKGHVVVNPMKNGHTIDLKELADDLRSRRITLPVLVRFSNILQKRIEKVCSCFRIASEKYQYSGQYYGVYPIKVNQQRQLVEEVVKFGRPYNFGLEAGSKPELHAVLALMNNPEALIVCNGYKDEAYIRLALIGQKLERQIIIVVEKLAELHLILRTSKSLNIRPKIGLRVKLSTVGAGRWQSSAGDSSKFGLTAAEIMSAVEIMTTENMLDCIQLLHFHLGSQIPDIRQIKDGMKEIRRFYVELMRLGCNIRFMDVGGGLGVDYDGSRSNSNSSANYSVQEYADDVVYHLYEICEEEQLPHPHIISESGRALTAHHSVILFDILEATTHPLWEDSLKVNAEDDKTILDLWEIVQEFKESKLLEAWHDALELKDQALNKFSLGLLSLQERAKAERLFWTIARKIHDHAQNLDRVPEEFELLREQLVDKYFCNFSIFQSLPDHWAIDQAFPIMPIHRLNTPPTKEATLQDVTCDSDGNIDQFVTECSTNPVLPVHEFIPDQPYLFGAFLVGAYQEILGDLHNLFGDTHAVHVALNPDGSWRYEQIITGENVKDVLDYVQFEADDLLERMARLIGISLGKGTIQQDEADELMSLYRQGLSGYTYLVSQ